MHSKLLIVFAKVPMQGQVKTRLAKTIGDEATLWVYEQLLRHTASIVSQDEFDLAVFYTPKVPDMDSWFPLAKFRKTQMGKDLGARLEHAFNWGLNKSYSRVITVGTDLWTIDVKLLEEAFNSLLSHDIVIGPAEDGGYYLLGLTKKLPFLFREIEWSTEKVFEQTMGLLKNYNVFQLQMKNDIDDIEDLKNEVQLWNKFRKHF